MLFASLLIDILVGLLVSAAGDVDRPFLLSRAIISDYVDPEAVHPIANSHPWTDFT